MKQFCPNCEKDSECIHAAELYECQECGEDFARYIVPRTNPDYYNHADIPAETSTVVTEPSNSDVSMTQDVLMTIKKRAVDAIEIVAPIDRTLNRYIDSAGNIFAVHQTEPVSIEERLAVIAHAVADDVINLIYEIEAETKRADGLSEMVEMYKTMLKSKEIIIGNQERRINELAERLLKGGE